MNRDDELEKKLKKMGVQISTSVSKNTYMVIAKDKNDETSKILEAKKLGIQVLSLDEFKTKFHL